MPAALGTGAERGGAALKSFLGRGQRADCHGGGGRRVSGAAGRAVSADFAFQTWACPRTSRRSWPADSPPGTAAARGTPASAAPRTQVSGAGRGGASPAGPWSSAGPGPPGGAGPAFWLSRVPCLSFLLRDLLSSLLSDTRGRHEVEIKRKPLESERRLPGASDAASRWPGSLGPGLASQRVNWGWRSRLASTRPGAPVTVTVCPRPRRLENTSPSAHGGPCRPRALRGQGLSWPPVGSRVPLLGSHEALEVRGQRPAASCEPSTAPEALVICRKERSLCYLGSDNQQGSRDCDAQSVSQQTFFRQPLLWPDAGLGARDTAVPCPPGALSVVGSPCTGSRELSSMSTPPP